MGIIILFIVAIIVSSMIVNAVQQLYMKVLGANVMFFNAKSKIIVIFFIAIFLMTVIMNIFGIEIPK